MATTLTTPKEEVKVVTTVQVTGFINNREEERCEIHYITLLEDGTPYQRGQVVINGYDDVKVFYAEMDALLATGKAFEEASTELLYGKVLASL